MTNRDERRCGRRLGWDPAGVAMSRQAKSGQQGRTVGAGRVTKNTN
jgi:hypothetical protein